MSDAEDMRELTEGLAYEEHWGRSDAMRDETPDDDEDESTRPADEDRAGGRNTLTRRATGDRASDR